MQINDHNQHFNNFVVAILCNFDDGSNLDFGVICNQHQYDNFELDDLYNNDTFQEFLHSIKLKADNNDLTFKLFYSLNNNAEIEYPSNLIPELFFKTIGV